MLKRLSQRLVSLWVRNEVILSEDASIYCYGLELLLSSAINLLIMIGLSLTFGKPLIFIPYILSFIPLRIYAGGYHAKNHVSCMLFNAALFSASLILITIVPAHNMALVCTVLNFISLIFIMALSPVPAKNKPLSEEEAVKYRRASIYLSVAILFLSFVLFRTSFISLAWYCMISYGELNSVFLMIVGKCES